MAKNEVWLSQTINNTKSLKAQILQTLMDQYRQEWVSQLEKSSKGTTYRLTKNSICLEKYFTKFTKKVYSPILQYRSGNHKLPIEIDRWKNIAYNQRMCPKCSKHSLGDEFHYLLECEFYKLAREQHIKRYYYRHPNELVNNSKPQLSRI